MSFYPRPNSFGRRFVKIISVHRKQTPFTRDVLATSPVENYKTPSMLLYIIYIYRNRDTDEDEDEDDDDDTPFALILLYPSHKRLRDCL